MHITAAKKELVRLVGRCQGVVDKKSTMPVLANVLLSVETPNEVRIAATDLYLSISGQIQAEVEQGGSTAIPARDFFERLKTMPDGPITVESAPGGSTEIRSSTSPRRFRLHGLPGDSFPALPDPGMNAPELELEVDILSSLISSTQFSISSDETRAHLSSALFEWDGDHVRMVTTDGHRLTKMEMRVAGKQATATMLIPLKAISELRKLADETRSVESKKGPLKVRIAQSGPNAFFSLPDARFSVKLVDAQFPAYKQVIPPMSNQPIRVPRLLVMEALRAVSLAASDRTGGVKLAIDADKMRITSESPESGDGFDEVPIDYAGPAVTVGFNAKYLMDVLAVLSHEEVLMHFSGELDPAVIRPASEDDSMDFVGVVMPMRI